MKRAIHLTLGCLIAAALCDGIAQAQFGRNPYHFWNNQVNAYNSFTNGRNPYIAYNNNLQTMQAQSLQGQLYTGNWQSQALMNSLAGQVYGTNYGIPTTYGAVANYYGSSYYPGYYSAFANPYAYGGYGGGLANPYAFGGYGAGIGNPYAPVGAGVANPYSPYGGDPSNPYSPLNPLNPYNPYGPFGPYSNPVGASLLGSAEVIKAYGQVINAQEDARIKREQALQAQLDTKKKAFDLDMYIKANTPTYTQLQQVAARNTLVRIQTNSLSGEIQSGKSLNYLLNDLKTFPTKLGEGKAGFESVPLSENALSHLNIVSKGNYGMGLLRDDGRITWPIAIPLSADKKKQLEEQIKNLVREAYKGKIDVNVLKDVRREMEDAKEELVKKVNDIPATQYRDAKRFFQEFDEASNSLSEAPVQAKYQKFVDGGRAGRSVQELVEYMYKEGLRFGPATADDEAAYRTVHAAMAAYDVAMNAQFGAGSKDQ